MATATGKSDEHLTQKGVAACIACNAIRPSQFLYAVNGFAVTRCRECGLGRTLIPHGFDPRQVYTEAYFQGGRRDGYADYRGSRATLQAEFHRLLDELAAMGARDGRLFELGCAYGFFLDEARATFQVCGAELAEMAVAACRARGLDVVRETTPEFYSMHGPFDVVAMLDVIEHLPAPDQTLRELAGVMRPGGLLVLTTGDFGSLFARIAGRRWRLMTPPQHLWFFTADTLASMLANAGFRVRRVSHPWKLVPLKLIGYQIGRYFGRQELIRRWNLAGGMPVNLFDAMRVVAEKV